MRFIDLFSGISGFHKGLLNTGRFECVFASEINTGLQEIDYKNFGIQPKGDIRKVHEAGIPKHNILCVGFPCQPFSFSGKKTIWIGHEKSSRIQEISGSSCLVEMGGQDIKSYLKK